MKVKIVKVYAVVMDGFYSHIEIKEIGKQYVDNEHTYFKSFAKAKKHLLGQLKDYVVQYKLNIANIKALTVDNLYPNSNL